MERAGCQSFWTQCLDGEFWASLVYADGRVYVLNQVGKVFVVKAGPEFELLAENKFVVGFNASPAIAGE